MPSELPQTWQATYPESAIDSGKGLSPDPGKSTGDDWVSAPATSHVHSFALQRGTGRQRDVITGASWVLVRFRDKLSGAITGSYSYKFGTLAAAEAVFGELLGAEHPGAHPMILRPGSYGNPDFLGYTKS